MSIVNRLGLHVGKNGASCVCGPCRHKILMLAKRAGVEPEKIVEKLFAPREEEPKKPVKVRKLTSMVSSTMTVATEGNEFQGPEAVLKVLEKLKS